MNRRDEDEILPTIFAYILHTEFHRNSLSGFEDEIVIWTNR
jgi:hypothetical protein